MQTDRTHLRAGGIELSSVRQDDNDESVTEQLTNTISTILTISTIDKYVLHSIANLSKIGDKHDLCITKYMSPLSLMSRFISTYNALLPSFHKRDYQT